MESAVLVHLICVNQCLDSLALLDSFGLRSDEAVPPLGLAFFGLRIHLGLEEVLFLEFFIRLLNQVYCAPHDFLVIHCLVHLLGYCRFHVISVFVFLADLPL